MLALILPLALPFPAGRAGLSRWAGLVCAWWWGWGRREALLTGFHPTSLCRIVTRRHSLWRGGGVLIGAPPLPRIRRRCLRRALAAFGRPGTPCPRLLPGRCRLGGSGIRLASGLGQGLIGILQAGLGQ